MSLHLLHKSINQLFNASLNQSVLQFLNSSASSSMSRSPPTSWLPVSQRISFRIAAMVSRCVLGFAPSYLRDLCRPVSDVAARRVLPSATRGELLVPRARLATRQRRAFSVVGPSIWNDLPPELRSLLLIDPTGFYKSLKSFFFSRGWAGSAPE